MFAAVAVLEWVGCAEYGGGLVSTWSDELGSLPVRLLVIVVGAA